MIHHRQQLLAIEPTRKKKSKSWLIAGEAIRVALGTALEKRGINVIWLTANPQGGSDIDRESLFRVYTALRRLRDTGVCPQLHAVHVVSSWSYQHKSPPARGRNKDPWQDRQFALRRGIMPGAHPLPCNFTVPTILHRTEKSPLRIEEHMEKFLYLSQQEVAVTGLSMRDVIASLEEMFREMGEGRVEMPPKPGIHPSGDAFIHAMPAYIPHLHAAGVKWVSAYPQNRERGLPYITGLLILNDPDTGMPLCVMDATWITAKRTGAATAIAAKYLARPDSRVVGILGCGVQGRSNLDALASVFPLERAIAYDPDRSVTKRYAREMSTIVFYR